MVQVTWGVGLFGISFGGMGGGREGEEEADTANQAITRQQSSKWRWTHSSLIRQTKTIDTGAAFGTKKHRFCLFVCCCCFVFCFWGEKADTANRESNQSTCVGLAIVILKTKTRRGGSFWYK